MSNVPDDWGAYYRRCPECGHTYHMSGTDECACVETFQCEHYKVVEQGLPSQRREQCDTEVTDEDDLITTNDGQWCKQCVDDYCFTCSACDEVIEFDEDTIRDPEGDEDGNYICIDCEDKQRTDAAMDALSESMNPVGGDQAVCVHCDESHHVDANHQCRGTVE